MKIFGSSLLVAACALGAVSCGPSRTTYARFPGAPPQFDRAQSAPQALEIADKVLAAAGGAAAWEKAKQIKWTQIQTAAKKQGVQAWDRWNARHYARLDRGEAGGVVVLYDIYGTFGAAFFESKLGAKQSFPPNERAEAVKIARLAWQLDATSMCMPFLLHEPGGKLAYAGVVKDGETEYHKLTLTFPAADTARAGLELHAIVDKTTNMLHRVEIETPANGDRVGYQLSDWTEAGGLKFPATRKNIGNNEIVTAKDIKVGNPNDVLFAAPPL